MKRLLILLACLLAFQAPALAVNPDEILDDPALEARARDISAQLRCLVCQNQSIDDSDADLAADLRILVRERLLSGDSNEEVIQYVVDRYGEFVLLRPVVAPHTLILWVAAPLVLVLGAGGLLLALRRRPGTETVTMTAEEREALARLEDSDQ